MKYLNVIKIYSNWLFWGKRSFWISSEIVNVNDADNDDNDGERWPWSSSWLRWSRKRRRSSNRYFEKYLQSSSQPSTQTTKNLGHTNGRWQASRGDSDKLGRLEDSQVCFLSRLRRRLTGTILLTCDRCFFGRKVDPCLAEPWSEFFVVVFQSKSKYFWISLSLSLSFSLFLSLSHSLTCTHTHSHTHTHLHTLTPLSLSLSPFSTVCCRL